MSSLKNQAIFIIIRKTMDFFSVPRLPGWSFQQRINGGVLPPPPKADSLSPFLPEREKRKKIQLILPAQ
jgi:hypothetical protein